MLPALVVELKWYNYGIKIFNVTLMPEEYGSLIFVLAPGAIIALGYMVAKVNKLRKA